MTNAHAPLSKVARTDVLAIRRTDYDMELAGEDQAQFLPRKVPEPLGRLHRRQVARQVSSWPLVQ
jgi:hypothetical protein